MLAKLLHLPESLWNASLDNPIVYSELRIRMRIKRSRTLLAGSVLLTAGILFLSARVMESGLGNSIDFTDVRGTARFFFGLVISTQLFIATAIAPSAAASGIAGERERQTYDLLRTTTLRAGGIVWGKFLSALAFTLLLIVAQTPFLMLAYIMGGPSLWEMVMHLAVITTSAIAYSALALFVSSRSKRTAAATTGTYILIALGTYILPLVGIMLVSFTTLANASNTITIAGLHLNAEFLATAISYLAAAINAPASMFASQSIFAESNAIFWDSTTINSHTLYYPLPWLITTLFNLLLSGFFLWLAKRNVQRQDI
ncbi:MAG: hypothetical protein D6755_06365 [Anaerolineae bacterium]|nr:MAG: hypothetical protein D6755_06365 [Anaerolineae bacterium]